MRFALAILALVQTASAQTCSNTCTIYGIDQTNNGLCSDGGTGSSYSSCAYGTDCADCGTRTAACVPVCLDNCGLFNSDAQCDDGGLGAQYSYCDNGNDCTDCGDSCRTTAPVVSAVADNGYWTTTTTAPCFAAETTTACKIVGDVAPAEARRQCYDETKGTDAELVLMKNLAAGDVVLAADAAGALSLERVVVNQHKANPLASALLEVHHSAGVLSLTPDHVLVVDGAFVPARDAKPGSALTLADGSKAAVERVAAAHGAVVNPVTSSGTIVADGVVAATHPEWSAGFMMASETTPLPLFYAAAAAFPATTQAYYDAVLEPLLDALGAHVKPAALGASALVAPFVAADAAAALGLVAFAGAAPVALLALGAAALRSRKA